MIVLFVLSYFVTGTLVFWGALHLRMIRAAYADIVGALLAVVFWPLVALSIPVHLLLKYYQEKE